MLLLLFLANGRSGLTRALRHLKDGGILMARVVTASRVQAHADKQKL
jgi:hypothetical protein